eukprot:TRINITY_DN711_c2_g5_i1.p1 TRINITY_DN711_c2_g5~~TRINITY_DN711_c2_g5_i1.p1  ORF type:complete len:154 (+),score=64.04 TRINITY_DN711_c2_g5_i1:70-462(+)
MENDKKKKENRVLCGVIEQSFGTKLAAEEYFPPGLTPEQVKIMLDGPSIKHMIKNFFSNNVVMQQLKEANPWLAEDVNAQTLLLDESFLNFVVKSDNYERMMNLQKKPELNRAVLDSGLHAIGQPNPNRN